VTPTARPVVTAQRERYAGAGGHPSAVGRAKDRENSPVKDQRFATVSRNHLLTFSAFVAERSSALQMYLIIIIIIKIIIIIIT